MRILVAGATGYVGSRLVPELLRRGHRVVAASSSRPAPRRFSWGDQVEWRQMDATDPVAVRRAADGCDAVCYLIHSLDLPGFSRRDRIAAGHVRDTVSALGIGRVVYLSGLVPDVPRRRLSRHIASRLEVEELLAESTASTLSLRAGIVLGAGSTSFEIIRQMASALLVRPVPSWLHARVQPVAIVDVVRVMAVALEDPSVSGHRDLGGPDVLSYPDLLSLYCEVAGLHRLSLPVLGPPMTLTALGAGLVTAAPYWTAAALVQSLRHDMVCDPAELAELDDVPMTPAREAIAAALAEAEDSPAGREPSDPDWVQGPWWDGRVAGVPVPFSTSLRATAHIVEHRVRGVLRTVL